VCSSDLIETRNTFSPEQFEWFKAGSAINKIRSGS
jgi:hypothetical protein